MKGGVRDGVRHCCLNVNKGAKMSRLHDMLLLAESSIPLYLSLLESTMLRRRKEDPKLGWGMFLHSTMGLVGVEC